MSVHCILGGLLSKHDPHMTHIIGANYGYS